MRAIILALMLGACASGGGAAAPEPDAAPSAFPVERGTAPPPPAQSARLGRAPPEGAGPGGIDFGQWRGADPATYQPAFAQQLRARFAGKDAPAIRADLEANGFVCADGEGGLSCRIETMERQCAFDWYYVHEARPVAAIGFDIMCLGAD